MASATLNIKVKPNRMLTQADAAGYAGLTGKQFDRECPVRPVEIAPGVLRYDMRDLDQWIDGLKSGTGDDDAILARLA